MAYPRELRAKERDLLDSVLPAARPGYLRARERLATMIVLGQGRRGEGDLVLGMPGDAADRTSPLPPVIAYGMVETTRDAFTITVREEMSAQVNVEIVSGRGEEVPDHFEEKRRWTYSTWEPGLPSPATGTGVRQVALDPALTLALAPAEERIWVHDAESGMVHLIPITHFYNELMRIRQARDPAIALRSRLFWEQFGTHTDAELHATFAAYNRLKHRVELRPAPELRAPRGIAARMRRLFGIGR